MLPMVISDDIKIYTFTAINSLDFTPLAQQCVCLICTISRLPCNTSDTSAGCTRVDTSTKHGTPGIGDVSTWLTQVISKLMA